MRSRVRKFYMNGYRFDVGIRSWISMRSLEDIKTFKQKLLKNINIDRQIENILTGVKREDGIIGYRFKFQP
jgi:hypothetical protein